MLAMHWPIRSLTSKIQPFFDQQFDQLCIQISATSIFLPLERRRASNYLDDKMFSWSRSENLDKSTNLDDSPNVKERMATIGPKDLIGRTLLMGSKEDGQRFQARVVGAVVGKEERLKNGLEYMNYICEVPNSTVDDILTYNDILDHIEKDNNDI
jgi:hypothetical protein